MVKHIDNSYDVESVVAHKELAYNNIDQSLFRSADWVGQYQMNMVVRICISTYIQNRFINTMMGVFGPYNDI